MSIRITGTRVGSSGNSTVFNDKDLEDMLDSLDSTVTSSEEVDLASDIVAELESEHGSSNVTASPTSLEYRWEWDPDTETWRKRARSRTSILVDDGNTTDARIVVVTTDDVP